MKSNPMRILSLLLASLLVACLHAARVGAEDAATAGSTTSSSESSRELQSSQTPPRVLGSKPIMGWSTWQVFRGTATEKQVLAQARAMKRRGLLDAGYTVLNVDDGWETLLPSGWISREHALKLPPKSSHPSYINPGCRVSDPTRYPSGMPWLSDEVRHLGFLFGISGFKPKTKFVFRASVEAQCISEIGGVSLIKIDRCGRINMKDTTRNFVGFRSALDPSIAVYNSRMGCRVPTKCGDAKKCPWAYVPPKSSADYPDHCREMSDLHRITDDIKSNWNSVLVNANAMRGHGSISRPYFWADPDFLIPDKKVFSLAEQHSLMSMWCVLSAPLILSIDVVNADESTIEMLKNKDAIEINQSYEGDAGDRLYSDVAGLWVHRKRFPESKKHAVVITHTGFKLTKAFVPSNQKAPLVIHALDLAPFLTFDAPPPAAAPPKKAKKPTKKPTRAPTKRPTKTSQVVVEPPPPAAEKPNYVCRIKPVYPVRTLVAWPKADAEGFHLVNSARALFVMEPRASAFFIVRDCVVA